MAALVRCKADGHRLHPAISTSLYRSMIVSVADNDYEDNFKGEVNVTRMCERKKEMKEKVETS